MYPMNKQLEEKASKINVVVTHKNAIYINGMRITNRNTKCGIHNTVEEFDCEEKMLIRELRDRGYKRLLPLIDIKEYVDMIEDN